MRRLTPNVEDLSVESFEADTGAAQGKGAVHAYQETWPFRCTRFCTYNCTGIPCFNSAGPGC